MWKKTDHHPWAEAEMAAVKTLLSKKIKSQKIPGKAECEEYRRLSKGKLRKRTCIRFHVKNIIARDLPKNSGNIPLIHLTYLVCLLILQ